MNITDNAKKIADSCRFCWMCRHVCPIGNATGLERNTARARAMGVSLVARQSIALDDIADNLYECALCGACTNNCVTGWDPKVFIREARTSLVLEGKTPKHIIDLIENYINCGNIYCEEICQCISDLLIEKGSDTLIFMGEDATIKSPNSIKNVKAVLDKSGVDYTFTKTYDCGSSIYFLTGKTNETLTAAKKFADFANNYKTVVVYDPVDLSLIKHEYKEWGVDITANVIGFNEYLLNLIDEGKLKVNKSQTEYSLQDNYAYTRELDNPNFGRKLIEKVGVVKDMLLIGKETNHAGSLLMNEYMPNVIKTVALNRWRDAEGMNCKVLVTENPSEYELLKATCPSDKRVVSVEEMILENL